jgi:putative endonuclease
MESADNYRGRLGRLGEDIACRMLESMGHIILERNWRSGHLEIDIISYDAAGIHFVEVKARRENIQAPPQENVDFRKQRRIVQAAQSFLKSGKGRPYGSHECMFDVVAVTFCGDTHSCEWIPQAFIPIYR